MKYVFYSLIVVLAYMYITSGRNAMITCLEKHTYDTCVTNLR